MNTIFAPATAPGKAGVTIIRISGDRALDIAPYFTIKAAIMPRMAILTKLRHPDTHALLDEALLLYFPAPHSFTGEDVVELHIHGSRAVLATLMGLLAAIPEFRVAEAGEFSRRAFENGKMDLTEAEGLADLIDAETQAQQQQALRQMQGALHTLYNGWRDNLIALLANMEAYIDFPDEDLPEALRATITQQVASLSNSMHAHLEDNRRGEKLRDGLYVAIIGAPNVGKSSLINYLAQRDIAIVSHIAGTTRDVLEVHLDIGGYPVIIADTAGLRETTEQIEEEGIRRARQRAEHADITIALFDAASIEKPDASTLELILDNSLVIINKIDAPHPAIPTLIRNHAPLNISLKTEEGVANFLTELEKQASAFFYTETADPVITRTRHRNLLQECLEHLERFSTDNDIELAAEDLRMAAQSLGKIIGRIDVEDILDAIFSSFCIGK